MSKKKYTNTTFTKRVDHEAGRHRPSRSMKEPTVCKECGSVYVNRRWTAANSPSRNDQREHWRPQQVTLCPACAQVRTGEPRGFLYLDGAFFVTHAEEIEQLLRNEAGRAAEDNPLARIMDWKRGDTHTLPLQRRRNIWPNV